MKRRVFVTFFLLVLVQVIYGQQQFTTVIQLPATPVKHQYNSGTCWCFSTTAMLECELMRTNKPTPDLSEAFTVYHIYIDKATRYLQLRGRNRFAEGGLGQDMLYALQQFGAMPQEVYPGKGKDNIMTANYTMADKLKQYLDGLLTRYNDTIPGNWKEGFTAILKSYIGTPPTSFEYNGKTYTPKSFAAEYVPFDRNTFTGLTSFTHHPLYTSFSMEVPDNYNNNTYFNLSLDELEQTVKTALRNGYTVTWDADVTNRGFQPKKGLAKWVATLEDAEQFPGYTEQSYTPELRQQLFEQQVTQDDHLMLITGLATDAGGKEYFIVKNSYGESGPYKGYVYVSMPYFAINTISVLVNTNALPATLVQKIAAERQLAGQ